MMHGVLLLLQEGVWGFGVTAGTIS